MVASVSTAPAVLSTIHVVALSKDLQVDSKRRFSWEDLKADSWKVYLFVIGKQDAGASGSRACRVTQRRCVQLHVIQGDICRYRTTDHSRIAYSSDWCRRAPKSHPLPHQSHPRSPCHTEFSHHRHHPVERQSRAKPRPPCLASACR